MSRLLNRFLCVCALAISVQRAGAFALLGPVPSGPPDDFEVPQIAYNLPGDVGTPQNLGEEFRWNTPDIYYSYDQNFLDYFASNGVFAVDQAFSILNSLTANNPDRTNFSSLSPELSEYPMEAQRVNYQAQALSMLDLKSTALTLFVEQLGLAEPDRYTWTLRNRQVGQGGCPADVTYNVIQRNFDPVISPLDQLQASSYVNGTLYTYSIFEICNSPVPPLADALEVAVDPLARTFTAVAARFGLVGEFFTGLTRDDVGGLRYLYRTNNMNVESAAPGAQAIVTNTTTAQLLFTSNLTLLVDQALTNNAAQLQALFPGLVIASTVPIFTNVVTTNVFFILTNYPHAPAGTFSVLPQTVITTNVVTWFSHTFANVVTNTYFTNTVITVVENGFTTLPNGPAGVFYPLTTVRTVATNFISGDYYLLPANSDCGVQIINTQLVSVINLTNTPIVATNATGQTNINGQQFAQSLVFHFTNRVFVINPVPCVADAPAIRQGMDRVRFIRRDFDSLVGQFIAVTNLYTLNLVTNNTVRPTIIRRVVTQPDFLISASDLTAGPPGAGANITPTAAVRSIQFNEANALPNLAGPGTIEPAVTFAFNKVGPQYLNLQPNFLDELTQTPILIWGSFDATTNAPVIYPNGTSIANLENQILILVEPSVLPIGNVGVAYNATFSVSAGGQSPFVWSLTPGTPGLPTGLVLSPGGILSGTPDTAATFDISVRVTDGGGRIVDRLYVIKIDP